MKIIAVCKAHLLLNPVSFRGQPKARFETLPRLDRAICDLSDAISRLGGFSAAFSNAPHPEARSPQGEASKDTPQRRSLHASNASAPAPPFEVPSGHLRVRLS
ncbi:hypothetical protein IE4803_CH00457 [Rhizobium etli bv. phaseoli str. IE4803]|nr:hypothetical protein IE4803_CH00457 [Rhizobium etli bv. phaseoli str. IE4803]